MLNECFIRAATVAACAAILAGCSELPGTHEQQGAVIGGASGAAVGAAVGGKEHRVIGAVLGGVLGAAGGYVVGANSDKILGKNKEEAETAASRAKTKPATAEDAKVATTGDLNRDGYVTLDEVVAMKDAGFTDEKILQRLEATGNIFDLTDEGKQYLRDHGISEYVVKEMQNLNQQRRELLLRQLNESR